MKCKLVQNRYPVQRFLNCCTKTLLLLLLGCLIWLPSLSISFAQTDKHFPHLIDNGGFIVNDGSKNLRHREKELFIPASTLKIFTCLAALEILGEEYRFETHFFLDDQQNLYIKGFGDPFLTSEVIRTIAEELYNRGVRQILAIRLDETSYPAIFSADGAGHTSNPFDAPNGALAVNFNSVPIFVSAGGTITSGEAQTPEIPVMYETGKNLPPGAHRININILQKQKTLSPSLRYTGELITALFNSAGITIQNGFHAARTPAHLPAIYIHRSEKNLREIVRSCLQYSNNYIANQLFLACGADSYGFPASWDKARRRFNAYAKDRLRLSTKEFYMVEGSGISRKNRISPAGLLKAVKRFSPYADLLNRRGKILIKSGTLSDVFCYAGFLDHHNRSLPFVIMLNQQKNNRDQLLAALYLAMNDNYQ
ncbi:MAG: D-alanyl-D-alanine carboxypeptidase [Desulfobulbaceae bacterium]|nr:D-alanyl-D-alanine carboxypeptidase [Desulfobulbaceae bacterium]